MQQVWDASEYAHHGRFVAELAVSLVNLLHPQPGERILDLGCGDGFLSLCIAESGAKVLGVDSSAAMLASARERGIEVQLASGEALSFEQEFDAVFSNAALHWMDDQDAVLRNVARALKPGGRFAAEMGGQGNIAAIRVALLAVLVPRGIAAKRVESRSFFTAEEYRVLLERHGFHVNEIALIPRPTPLPSGMGQWLRTFCRSLLAELPAAEIPATVNEISSLLEPVLRDRGGNWTADYVRLRFLAHRP